MPDEQKEFTVVAIISMIVKAKNEQEAVQRAGLPFQYGAIPNMGKFLINGVRETISTDRDPIDMTKI